MPSKSEWIVRCAEGTRSRSIGVYAFSRDDALRVAQQVIGSKGKAVSAKKCKS